MKRIAAIMIASLFVLTAFAVLEMPMAKASTPTQNFSFPYSYGQPQVPNDVGAQGIQGPTVPFNQIGSHSAGLIGGTIGTDNTSQQEFYANISNTSKNMTTVTINVYNGTLQSHTASIGATVTILSDYTGNWSQAKTSSLGSVVFNDIKIGWNYIVVQVQSTYINFSQLRYITQNYDFNVYLVPKTLGILVVNNGPVSDLGNYWIVPRNGYWLANAIPQWFVGSQLNVSILNNSNGGALLGTAITLSNGSVEVEGLNSAYNYGIFVDGYKQGLTGIIYGYVNASANIGGPAPGTTTTQDALFGWTTTKSGTSGKVVGTTMPAIGSWSITTPTIIYNGTTYLNYTYVSGSNSDSLSIYNDTMYVNTNSPGVAPTLTVNAYNSTIVFGSIAAMNAIKNVTAHNSVIIDFPNGLAFKSPFPGQTYYGGNGLVNLSMYSSILYGMTGSSTSDRGTIYNSIIIHLGIPPHARFWAVVNESALDAGGAFGGSIEHSLIETSTITFNTHLNITSTQVINSSLGPAVGVTTYLEMNDDYLVNSTLGGQLLHSNYTQDTFIASGASNVSYQYIYPTRNSTTFYEPRMGFSLGDYAHISESYITMTMPEWTPNFISLDGGTVINSIISFNVTGSDIVKWESLSRYAANLPPGIMFEMNFDNGGNTTFANNRVYGVMLQLVSNDTVRNNVFSNYNYGQFILGPNGYYPLGNVVIENNTFDAGGRFNLSALQQVYGPVTYPSGPGYSNTFVNTIGEPNNNYAIRKFVYNTFNIRETGIVDFITADLYENFANISDNVFSNSQLYGNTIALPYSMNIYSTAHAIISNNYFLNLNNYTIPLYIGNNSVVSNNHFYYFPYQNATEVPIGVVSSYTNYNHYPYFPSSYKQLTFGYIVHSGSSVTFDGAEYTFNSTTQFSQNISGYVYNITPDVNTLSGTPTISYSNGLVGGPQPNFTWDGYKYTESVEPSYIQVGVNSANAPPVNLQFNGAPNTAYSVAMYDHGQLIDYTNVTSSANGVVTFTYNPATMPLDPVFELTTFHIVTSGSTAVPPEVFLYVLLAGGALLGAGAIIVAAVDRRRYR